MSRFDTIRDLCASVIQSSGAGIAEVWEYRRLTSKPSSNPRTYSDWEEVAALNTQGRETEMTDADKGGYKRFSVGSLRLSYNALTPMPVMGDQFKDPQGQVWNLAATASSGPGSIAFSIVREIGTITSPDRKGGL